MATCALLSEPSVVYIVTVVAINATPARGIHLLTGTCMTRHAGELRVCTIDDKSRFLMMVKVPDTPIPYVVADITR